MPDYLGDAQRKLKKGDGDDEEKITGRSDIWVATFYRPLYLNYK